MVPDNAVKTIMKPDVELDSDGIIFSCKRRGPMTIPPPTPTSDAIEPAANPATLTQRSLAVVN